MKRVWIDTAIGTSPDDATALLFACLHPELDVVGVSISGTQQQKRLEEAYAVLDYARSDDVKVYLGDDVERTHIERAQPDHTITLGPLTNIARLVLEETQLGRLHIRGGAFREVDYRGEKVTAEWTLASDKDATRIVLTQYDDVCINALEASSALVLEKTSRDAIKERHVFLENRYQGFAKYLVKEYGGDRSEILMNAVLPVCDILNTATITREVIEFYIQPDGSFRRAYTLAHRPPSIVQVIENPEGVPVPLVKHEVIRSVESSKVFDELLAVL